MKKYLLELILRILSAVAPEVNWKPNCRGVGSVEQSTQILLAQKYREMLHQNAPLPGLDEVEFRAYSQNGEDGILLYIFSLIGTTNKKCVEICVGNGIECNSANLIINHGWDGLLFDGNIDNINAGRIFYSKCKDTFSWPPKMVHEWVTAENVNDLITSNGLEGEIDLLSLDIDGMDYWIWKAIECVQPRVVVVEYQDIWGPLESKTVPYDQKFKAELTEYGPDYCGASLNAFIKLANEKGYRFVGCQRYGFNGFFIRNGIADNILPETDTSACFKHPKVLHGMKHRLPKVVNRPWIDV